MRKKKTEDTQEQTSQTQVDINKQDCIINLEGYHKLKGIKINLTAFSDNYKEEIEKLKNKLKSLALEHTNLCHDLTDSNEAKMIEKEAVQLIIDYCVKENYLVNRLPTKKKYFLEVDKEDENDFGSQRYQFYIHPLINQKEEVSELSWTDVVSFWKAQFNPKEE